MTYEYSFKVNKDKLLGSGGFRNCYEALGRKTKDSPVEEMVAKSLRRRGGTLKDYLGMGSLYQGVDVMIRKFQEQALGVTSVSLISHWRSRIQVLKVISGPLALRIYFETPT